jgi:DNA-binding CsgD family transcriptional regulator
VGWRADTAPGTLIDVGRELMTQRVLRDVEVLARAGLDLDTFMTEALDSVGRAVPHVAACIATVDPSTLLLTGTHKFGDLYGRDEHDDEWGLREYGEPEVDSFIALSKQEFPAAGVHARTGGQVHRSARLVEFMRPHYGYADEARVVFRDGGQVWGGAALFREPGGDEGFDQADLDLLASLSTVMSAGMRAGLLTRLADAPPLRSMGPAVLVVGADGTVQQMSAGAEDRLADLAGGASAATPTGIISALVGAARGFAAGLTTVPPRCRVRSRSGMWLVLHASPLSPRGERHGDVVVTIDEARPPEIVPLVVAAFDLTQRERDVTQLVLQGVDTKEIASTIHVSTYTVQDHLKSVFDKAGVRSRRELIARIYFDQYVPRMGTEVGPSGWFASV